MEKWIIELLCARIAGVDQNHPNEFQAVKSLVETKRDLFVYTKKDYILDNFNHMLKVSQRGEEDEMLDEYPKCVVEAVDRFCVKLGQYLKKNNIENINLKRSEIGIDISVHRKMHVLVTAGFDVDNSLVTVSTDSRNSTKRIPGSAGSVLLPDRLFDQERNTISTTVYKRQTGEVNTVRFNISVVFYRKTSFSLRSNNGRVAVRMPHSSTTMLSPIKLNFKSDISLKLERDRNDDNDESSEFDD